MLVCNTWLSPGPFITKVKSSQFLDHSESTNTDPTQCLHSQGITAATSRRLGHYAKQTTDISGMEFSPSSQRIHCALLSWPHSICAPIPTHSWLNPCSSPGGLHLAPSLPHSYSHPPSWLHSRTGARPAHSTFPRPGFQTGWTPHSISEPHSLELILNTSMCWNLNPTANFVIPKRPVFLVLIPLGPPVYLEEEP